MQERDNTNAIITGNICKSLIILLVVKQIILANKGSLQKKVSCLVIFCFEEGINTLNVESGATLVGGLVAQSITILAINYLYVHNVKVSF